MTSIRTEIGTTPRNGLPPVKPYVYRGTGTGTLTPLLRSTPARIPGSRQARLEQLASMRLWDSNQPCPRGFVTARQAAEQLGVNVRTVLRYKRELRERGVR